VCHCRGRRTSNSAGPAGALHGGQAVSSTRSKGKHKVDEVSRRVSRVDVAIRNLPAGIHPPFFLSEEFVDIKDA